MTTLPEFPETARGVPAQPGAGTLLTANEYGIAYGASPTGTSWPHSFKPSLAGNQISFSRGLVEQFEPTIKGEKISTGVLLTLDKKLVNADGESWCCIQFIPTPDGFLDKNTKVEMVHTDHPTSINPNLASCIVCLVLWQGSVPVNVHEVLHFNVRYVREILKAGGVRHHFP